MSRIRLLQLAPIIGKGSFGVGPVVLSIAGSQINSPVTGEIWTVDGPSEARQLERQYGLVTDSIRSFPIMGPRRLAFSAQLERAIEGPAEFDIVHQHGLWTAVSHATRRWRARFRRPTIITPHGSLESFALRRSTWKKRLALALYERRNLEEASCLHALSRREARGFREFGLRNPIAIIPNAIPDAWLATKGDGRAFRKRYCVPDTARIMLFLGRITPIKGLPMLLRAMDRSRQSLHGWILAIAGVNEFDHQRELESLTGRLELRPYVKFVGPQYQRDKADAYAAADLFVLPSYSEAAPIAVLEALGAGVPVLTTKASDWEALRSDDCGWWTDISEQAISEALKEAVQQPPARLHEMGARGRNIVKKDYSWAQLGLRLAALHRWLLSGGLNPDFVVME